MGLFDRDDEEKKEKPDFSNVESGSSSTAPEPDEADEPRTYTVERGDTLWAISERFYGKGNEWRRIYEANRDRIEDPDVIQPGWELTIPEAEDENEQEGDER